MPSLSLLILQTQAEYRKVITIPTETKIKEFASMLNVTRQNHKRCREYYDTQHIQKEAAEGGMVEYKVDWEGNWAPTWEPSTCLFHCQDKVAEYKSRAAPTSSKRPGKRKRPARRK